MAKKTNISSIVNIVNKKARFEFELQDKYVAGIALMGSEIKSIRQNNVSLQEAYCVMHGSELFVRGMNIAMYKEAGDNNHDPTRERKLLLKRQELRKIKKKLDEKGLAVVPTRLFINDRGLAKMEVAVGKGKKLVDKRQTIKDKDQKRDLDRLQL